MDRAFLEKCYEIAWLQCTMCKRCSMYCPFGIDVATMIAIARSVCHSQGVTPKQLAFFSDHCDKTGNHMGIPVEELVDTCEWMAEDFRDMAPNREHNHCCGGGIMPMGPDYKPFRMASGKLKAEQIKATGAKIVITACHNCFDQINDLSEEYELGVTAFSFKEIIVDAMIIPEHMRLETE